MLLLVSNPLCYTNTVISDLEQDPHIPLLPGGLLTT